MDKLSVGMRRPVSSGVTLGVRWGLYGDGSMLNENENYEYDVLYDMYNYDQLKWLLVLMKENHRLLISDSGGEIKYSDHVFYRWHIDKIEGLLSEWSNIS